MHGQEKEDIALPSQLPEVNMYLTRLFMIDSWSGVKMFYELINSPACSRHSDNGVWPEVR